MFVNGRDLATGEAQVRERLDRRREAERQVVGSLIPIPSGGAIRGVQRASARHIFRGRASRDSTIFRGPLAVIPCAESRPVTRQAERRSPCEPKAGLAPGGFRDLRRVDWVAVADKFLS